MLYGEVAHALGDRAVAALLAPVLAPYADQFVYTGTSVYGSVRHTSGLLAHTVGDIDGAQRRLRRAALDAAAMPAPFFAAWAEHARRALGH